VLSFWNVIPDLLSLIKSNTIVAANWPTYYRTNNKIIRNTKKKNIFFAINGY